MTEDRELLTELPFGLPGKIFRSPMPFGPYDRLSQIWDLYLQNDVQVVVVLTEKQEYLVHSSRDLLEFYRSQNFEVSHCPIQDFKVPSDIKKLESTISDVINQAASGKNFAVHCMAGLGRTGIFMACLAKRRFQMDGKAAIDWVRANIPGAMENTLQEQFVLDF